ncbi:MAG: AAA family ATPase [Kiritimatiellae bacterium]|nr:AAA family ATPase [Kiritimatiellia bacterium]
MEKIATDIYTFSQLRNEGFTYVDKTDALFAMASGEIGKQFFIARPRRFGKSLAISTLESLFQGERELFKGLAIEPKWDWSRKWPVLHLDMGSAQTTSVPELHRRMRAILANECHRNGIPFRDDENPSTAFENIINDLAAKSPDGWMVLLVDEYDKPILGHLMKPESRNSATRSRRSTP